MPAHSHLNGKKREKNPIFFLRENERLSSDTRQQNVNLGKREERKLFWLPDSKSLISCRYIYFTAIQLNYAFTADKGYYNDTEIWSWRKSCSEVGLYKLLSSLFYFLCSLLSLSLSLSSCVCAVCNLFRGFLCIFPPFILRWMLAHLNSALREVIISCMSFKGEGKDW